MTTRRKKSRNVKKSRRGGMQILSRFSSKSSKVAPTPASAPTSDSVNLSFIEYLDKYVRLYKKENLHLIKDKFVYFYRKGAVYIGTIDSDVMKTSIMYGGEVNNPTTGNFTPRQIKENDKVQQKDLDVILRIPLSEIDKLYTVEEPTFNWRKVDPYNAIRTINIDTSYIVKEVTPSESAQIS
jgi:hypothetical protein